jgi:hypothetical protein
MPLALYPATFAMARPTFIYHVDGRTASCVESRRRWRAQRSARHPWQGNNHEQYGNEENGARTAPTAAPELREIHGPQDALPFPPYGGRSTTDRRTCIYKKKATTQSLPHTSQRPRRAVCAASWSKLGTFPLIKPLAKETQPLPLHTEIRHPLFWYDLTGPLY